MMLACLCVLRSEAYGLLLESALRKSNLLGMSRCRAQEAWGVGETLYANDASYR
jgi:hypothetical protein